MKNIVTIPESLDSRKKTWRKRLQSVDKSKSNGFAFIGEWLRAGEQAELEVGAFVLAYDEPGSMKNWYPQVRLFKVTDQGLEEVFSWKGDYGKRSWALAVRDEIANMLASTSDPKVLRAELLQRKEQLQKELDLVNEQIEMLNQIQQDQ